MTVSTLQTSLAIENSVAGRHADHPLMTHLEATRGRGPLWRVVARVLDLVRPLPDAISPRPGLAIVPASRGSYAISAVSQDGRVTRFSRWTPTDHLWAPDGIWDRTLAAVPPGRDGDADVISAILDPCVPLTLKEPAHA